MTGIGGFFQVEPERRRQVGRGGADGGEIQSQYMRREPGGEGRREWLYDTTLTRGARMR